MRGIGVSGILGGVAKSLLPRLSAMRCYFLSAAFVSAWQSIFYLLRNPD
jgi:hypothetical protein